jgi:stage II sporulation protein D
MKKLLLLIPCSLLFILPLMFFQKDEIEEAIPEEESESCTILITVNGQQMPLDDYLIGVLAGEMPVSFHEEALKAQAIAARTYALKQTSYGEKAIQATTAHQVFQATEQRQEKWKEAFITNENKLAQAVHETENQIITYNGELITAMFHSSSLNTTESAKNFSGSPIPYLQSVSSPEQRPNEEMRFTFKQLNSLLKQNFSANSYKNIKLVKNDTDRVAQVQINDSQWTGREFREMLQLKSTDFNVKWSASGLTITTYGYGHGIGMSQHGANTLAKNGQTAEQILAHYYPNTTIEKTNYCKNY